MQRLDEVAADVQRHHRQALVFRRPLHATADEEVTEAVVGGETADAGRRRTAAAAGAIEPPRLADQCEANWPAAVGAKLGDVETLKLAGIEVGRPVRGAVLAAGETRVDRCGTALRIEVEAEPFGHTRSAGG